MDVNNGEETSQVNIVVGVFPELGNAFTFWNSNTHQIELVQFDSNVMPVCDAVFNENGFALLTNVYQENSYSTSRIYYYSVPDSVETFPDEFLDNVQAYDIYAVPAYRPEKLMYNRLTKLWTLFYRHQSANNTEVIISYTASSLSDLKDGVRSVLSDTQGVAVNLLQYNQYGFFSFGNNKVMLSASPKNIYDLLSYLNYTTKQQQDELNRYKTIVDNLGATVSDIESDYVSKTRTINNKALSADITLSASDVGALGATDTADRATADASGNNIVNTYATKTDVTNVSTSVTNETSKKIVARFTAGQISQDFKLTPNRIWWIGKYICDCFQALQNSDTSTFATALDQLQGMLWLANLSGQDMIPSSNLPIKPQTSYDETSGNGVN